MTFRWIVLRLRSIPHLLALAAGAGLCLAAAVWARNLVEARTLRSIDAGLSQSGHEWTVVQIDGLHVTLSGVAPDEATRFAALSTAGRAASSARIMDRMEVADPLAIQPPGFSIEILRYDSGVSLAGLVPSSMDVESVLKRVREQVNGAPVSDSLGAFDLEPADGWHRAVNFGIEALGVLPRAKASITASRVSIDAAAEDADDKRKLERQLRRDAPSGLELALNISAPRPVAAPFTLRFLIDGDGARFDACSADSEAARDAILEAARRAGLGEDATCILALGTPSARWGEAAVAGIGAVAEIGGGTFTMSNADVTLTAKASTPRPRFERVSAELVEALPPVFSLKAVLPEEGAQGEERHLPEFTATLSPEGHVQLRGQLGSDSTRAAVESLAVAHFGSDQVHSAPGPDQDLPSGWTQRVLAALESMQFLSNGIVNVTADKVTIAGNAAFEDAQSAITGVLSDRLGGGATYELDVTYVKVSDPQIVMPTPEECLARISEAAERKKITFNPSSSTFDDDAAETIDAIADAFRECEGIRVEISGHTDSQGRETMNQRLSQARADAVLNAILARRVLGTGLVAKGYGERRPVADNDTAEGREANRRIEFRLIGTSGDLTDLSGHGAEILEDDDVIEARDGGGTE
ncbi:MAG: OmpA family protein [Boseongicola sp. SB0673_bin_14]|nr:OmpA family protein [Boseongicola sp. SB0673_bin_14]